jgi:hypothetical protein
MYHDQTRPDQDLIYIRPMLMHVVYMYYLMYVTISIVPTPGQRGSFPKWDSQSAAAPDSGI